MVGHGRASLAARALIVLVGLAGPRGAAGTEGAHPGLGQERTLAVFPAADGAYELVLEACKRGEQPDSPELFRCPFAVRLSVKGQVVGREELPYRACGAAEPMAVDRVLGADPAAQAWRTADDCEVQVAARAVEMAPGITALLVTQRTGSEAYYRHHQLFLSTGRQLREAWNHAEQQGRDWSTTSVLPTGQPHHDDVALIAVASSAADGADKVTAVRLSLDSQSGNVVTSPLPDARAPLQVVRAGRFRSATEAYAARGSCLDDFQVFNARSFPGLGLRDFFLGMVLPTETQARKALGQLAHCAGAPQGTVQLFRASTRRPR